MKSRQHGKRVSNFLMKASSSMPNILRNKNRSNDFNTFTQYIDKQLSFYNLDPKELGTTKSIFHKTGIKLTENEKLCMKTAKYKKNPFGFQNFKDTYYFRNTNQSLYNKTFLSVSGQNNFYDNPGHSYNILRKNDTIAHDIIRQNLFRQKEVFKEAMRKIKLNKVFYMKKMPFMKVSTLMPNLKKEYVFFSLKNPPVEINSENNINNTNNNNPSQNEINEIKNK